MEQYAPPFTITNEMLLLVGGISEKIGRLDGSNALGARPRLRRSNQIRSIHSTLLIEANSLSFGQVRDVIDGKTVLGAPKEIQEVKNAYAAYEQLSELDPYSMDDLKRLHGVMTRYLVEESGVFRGGEEGVFNGDRCIFMAPPASLVPQLTSDLFDWMDREKDRLHPLILSAVFHYEFVFIHPFADGNGRMARLWHTALLSRWKSVFAFIPVESQIEKYQEGYYDAIAACHRNGNSDAFITFMLRQIDSLLAELLESVADGAEDVSPYTQKLLDVMEFDREYPALVIMQKLGLRSRETFRRHYLHPALQKGLVTMTLPDKPNSKNQRYVKVR